MDWSDPDYDVWVCSGDGSGLNAFEELPLSCSRQEGIKTCPTTNQVRLNKIVVRTVSCQSCSLDEGIHLDLTGSQGTTCSTDKLSHPDRIDFSPCENGEFSTETDDQVTDGWGTCYEVQYLDTISLKLG